ncbi:amino acid permease [Streptomyces longispororuber]|uniref:Amino acid permease n=1 Tax=Streptomyces longispororuber TaxID=68230 RepID=A0A918ZGJ7_9ACTN|nr:APC family permease [Streptomyces longispororuber]GHE48561.1 amino acid permease [Streptomyces longispororuber]
MPNPPRRLSRTLHTRSLTFFGLAYLAPMIILGTFGVLAETTGGAVPTAYLLAFAAMLFTARSYSRMAQEYPVSGSAYTYVRKAVDGRFGFLVGWTALLDYFFLPMVIWLIGASFLSAQFPGVPEWIWIVAFISATSALNILGIKVAARANLILVGFQLLVLACFVGLSFSRTADQGGSLISTTPFFGEESTFAGITTGAAIAAYSFLGFDAVTTLTEEAVDPVRNVPRAIMLTVLIGGGIYLLVAYATQLAHPGGVFRHVDSAALDLARLIGGRLFSSVFLAGLVVTQFASGIAAQASVSRLLYAMGRDGVLPARVFARVSSRFLTPVLNILLAGAIGLVAIALDVETSTSFINFGAFTAFTAVNLCPIVLYFRSGRRRPALGYLVIPAVGAAVCAWLLSRLDEHALLIGSVWLTCGLVYLAWLTGMFRRQPPEMVLDHADPVHSAAARPGGPPSPSASQTDEVRPE